MLDTRTIWCLMGITTLFGIRFTVLGFGQNNCFLTGIGIFFLGIIATILVMVALAIVKEDTEDHLPSSIWYGN